MVLYQKKGLVLLGVAKKWQKVAILGRSEIPSLVEISSPGTILYRVRPPRTRSEIHLFFDISLSSVQKYSIKCWNFHWVCKPMYKEYWVLAGNPVYCNSLGWGVGLKNLQVA